MKCFKIICLLSVFVIVSASPAIENGSESKYENKVCGLTVFVLIPDKVLETIVYH